MKCLYERRQFCELPEFYINWAKVNVNFQYYEIFSSHFCRNIFCKQTSRLIRRDFERVGGSAIQEQGLAQVTFNSIGSNGLEASSLWNQLNQ